MMKYLRIHLLGHFDISIAGRMLSVRDWQSQQAQIIGKILITNRGKIVTSEHLIEILWPDESIETARWLTHLRISQIRNLLQDKKLVQTVHGGCFFQHEQADPDLPSKNNRKNPSNESLYQPFRKIRRVLC